MKLFGATPLSKQHTNPRQDATESPVGRPPSSPTSYRSSLPWRVFNRASTWADRKWGWDRLPVPLSLVVLIGVRNELRRKNLYDTDTLPAADVPPVNPPSADDTVRTFDGTYNDLESPPMGRAGARFGRNVPLASVNADPDATILEPNPREVSRRLLTRTEFQPATSINVIVSAWLQFMIHDWFSHGRGDKDRAYRVPLSADDDWAEQPMLVPRTVADPTRPADADGPPTFANTLTHWWDLSSIYGTSEEEQRQYRTGEGGKLRIAAGEAIPLPVGRSRQGPDAGAWVLGRIGMLVSLFAHEHNAICERLQRKYPDWSDEEMFQRSRLVNAARGGEDPYRRVDSRRDRPSHDADRDARQLVRHRRREALPALRPTQPKRGHQRHPRFRDPALRGAVLPDRGVRRGLSDAPAAA